jgi:hypothetical protein
VKRVAALFEKAARSFTHLQVHVDISADGYQQQHQEGEKEEEGREGGVSERAAAVVRTSLQDYFEKIARFAAGPRKTVYFIHDCLH